MKTTFAATLLFIIATTMAQSYPDCSMSCLTNPTDLGSCDPTDTTCLCNDSDFISAQSACFEEACTDSTDLANAFDAAVAVCKSVGVTLSTGSASVSGVSSTSTSTSSAETSASTTTSSDNAARSMTISSIAVIAVVAVGVGANML